MRPNDFWNLEDKELSVIIDEYENNKFQNNKLLLEENRLINYHIVAVQNGKIKKPKQLYKFQWEADIPKLTIKQIQDNLLVLGVPKRLKDKYKVD